MKKQRHPSALLKFATKILSKTYHKKNPPVEISHHRPTVGLALSSGGARGLSHIGVLQVLEEAGITIDAIAGSSMGAYIGAHVAKGVSTSAMLEVADSIKDKSDLWKIADPVIPPTTGFLKGEKVTALLRNTIGDPMFSELNMPFFAVAFDLDSREKIVFNKGNVVHAVHASCAIPGIITPVMVDNRRCADGGVVDPVPVSVLKERTKVDYIIAVSLLPTLEDMQERRTIREAEDLTKTFRTKFLTSLNKNTNVFAPGNTVDTLRQSIKAAQAQIAHSACEQADITIRPDCYNLPWHSFDALDDVVEAGRVATRLQLPHIKQHLASLSSPTLNH